MVERAKLSWGSEQGSCWVYGQMTTIRAERRATIEVGWWWKARHCPHPVIAYGLIYEGNRGLSLDGFEPSSGLSVGRLGTRRLPYLYAPSKPPAVETIQTILQESMRPRVGCPSGFTSIALTSAIVAWRRSWRAERALR